MRKLLRVLTATLLFAVCGSLIGCMTLGSYPDYIVYDEYGRPVAVISTPPTIMVPMPMPYGYPYGYLGGHPNRHHRH